MNFEPLPSKSIMPSIAKVWRLHELLEIAATILIALGLLWSSNSVQWAVRIISLVAAVLLCVQFINFFLKNLQQRAWRYELWDNEIETLNGVIFKKRSLIPLSAIQFVDTTQGPIESKFKLMSLKISTAAKEHRIPGLDPETAASLRTAIISKTGISSDG